MNFHSEETRDIINNLRRMFLIAKVVLEATLFFCCAVGTTFQGGILKAARKLLHSLPLNPDRNILSWPHWLSK